MEAFPTKDEGVIAVDNAYLGRNIRIRTCLEKMGIPSSEIPRLPANDGNFVGKAPRTTEGGAADLAAGELTRAVVALNKLNETQFTMLNNDIRATVEHLFDTRQLVSAEEHSAPASGLILQGNLRIQVLSVAIRSATYTNKMLEGAARPRKNFKEFQDMMGLIESALRREAMVHRQPISWASEDVLRRVSRALILHTEALPANSMRLRLKMTEAAGKIDTYREAGKVTFHDIKTAYVDAYRKALESTADRRTGDSRDQGEAEVVLGTACCS